MGITVIKIFGQRTTSTTPAHMALCAARQRLPACFRSKNSLAWGSVLAVGLVATSLGSAGGGNVRSGTVTAFRRFRFTRAFSSTANTLFFSFTGTNSDSDMTPSASLVVPQKPLKWDHSAEDITRLTNEFIAKDRAVQDKIAAIHSENCNFSSV